jgi:N-acyl-D-amino-acid deacylase
MNFDLLIRNAQTIDGTGQSAYLADVGIRGDRIAALFLKGVPQFTAKRTLDAQGLTLIPGLIDPHSHADLLLPLPPAKQAELLRGKLAQGITTTIIGNCGLGCAPLANAEAVQILRAVNAWMTPQPMEWKWRTVGEYLNQIASNGLALNIATLVPHGPVRISAMGLAQGRPSPRQLKQMRKLVEQALRDGALGLSTGLIYPPGMYSAPEELQALAEVVAAHGGIYTSHIRGSSELLIPAVQELLELGRATGVRVHHSHNEAVGRAHWAKIDRVLALEEQAEREGVRVSFDMFPYTAAATMMIALYPPWALAGGVDCLLARLADQKTRRRIERDIERLTPRWPAWPTAARPHAWPHNLVKATGWEAIYIGYVESRRNKRFENKNLTELAKLTGKTPFDAIADLLIEERGQVSMLIFEVTGERESSDLLAKYARHRLCAFCTDAEDYGRGLPHPAAYGAFPRIFSQFVRQEKVLSLPEAVRKMTSYPAQLFGLSDRGVIRPGAFADLVLLDPNRVRDRASFARPRQLAAGIETVLVNGQLVLARGAEIQKLAGAVLRRTD